MIKAIFITGISSGIGKGLALHYAAKAVQVYGVSRRAIDFSHENIKHIRLDITQKDSLRDLLEFLPKEIDLCLLNAGTLGEMSTMKDVTIDTLQSLMNTNVWSQKLILDHLIENNKVTSIMGLSSGAAINGNVGWAGYSISKAALNMLIQLYAKENPDIHFTALAPGLVDTAMQDYICEEVDANKFPSIQRLKDSRNTTNMPNPEEFAKRFDNELEAILKTESGIFVDIRKL
jgi:NAD(P)-dependent dehydrogenase (short-subunit alcohol dehydrogenase family)